MRTEAAMEQGKLDLRSGTWSWRLVEPERPGEARRLRLRPEEHRDEEMIVMISRESTLTESAVREMAEQATSRRFSDEDGVLWTAEVKVPRVPVAGDRPLSPMVLFWSEQRACLATLRPRRGLGEMTTEELRAQLRACLNG